MCGEEELVPVFVNAPPPPRRTHTQMCMHAHTHTLMHTQTDTDNGLTAGKMGSLCAKVEHGSNKHSGSCAVGCLWKHA